MELSKSEIEKQAKQILDNFAKELEKINLSKSDFLSQEDMEFQRIEKDTIPFSDDNFKQNMLKNAPYADNDFIKAEKGEWK